MRYRFAILIGSLLAAAPAVAHDCCHGYDHHYYGGHHCCADCGRVGPSTQQSSAPVENLKGTIAEINHPPSAAGVVEAWLKTAGSTVLIRLCPADFLRQNGLTLKEGTPIAVKGYRAGSSDDDSLIATEIEIGGKTLPLRSGRGQPLW